MTELLSGANHGAVSADRLKRLDETEAQLRDVHAKLKAIRFAPHEWTRLGLKTVLDGTMRTAADMLARSDVTFEALQKRFPDALGGVSADIAARAEIEHKYAAVVEVQREEIEVFKREEGLRIPDVFEYRALAQLSAEEREKLSTHRPTTLAAATRIAGITPTSLIILMYYLKRNASQLWSGGEDTVSSPNLTV